MADKCKFEKYQYQVSYDNGSTWQDVTPIQVRKGNIIEASSIDCGEIDTIYRWVDLEGTYICNGNNKYTRQIQEESYDNGVSWYASYPTVYQEGTFVGVDADYCCDKFIGHYAASPTSPTSTICPKWYAWNGFKCVYVDPIKVVKCNDDTTLRSGETRYYDSNFSLIFGEIGNTVTSIGNSAFQSCTSLSSVTIPNTVTSIGQYAFGFCRSLTSIDIPNSVTSIGWYAFQGCTSLTSCTIGNSVTSIGTQAFQGCTSLKSIVIPNSVTSIDDRAFSGCSSLTSCTLSNNITLIDEGVFSNSGLKSMDIPYGVTTLGCGTCLSSTIVGPFNHCTSLESLNIPNSVRVIGYSSFNACTSLTSVTIPSSTYYIGAYAFSNCSGLQSITINATTPPTLGYYSYSTTRYYNAFYGSNCPIYVPCESVEDYKSSTYWSSYTSRIRPIPPCGDPIYRWEKAPTTDYVCVGVDKHYKEYYQVSYDSGYTWEYVVPLTSRTSEDVIEYYSLDCGYVPTLKFAATYSGGRYYSVDCDPYNPSEELTTETTKPSGYQYTAMTEAIIGSCITSIGRDAFSSCSGLTSVGVVGSGASVEIPSGVTSIGRDAFNSCTSLTSVTIPDNVTSIGMSAFYNCRSLTSITVEATTPPELINGYNTFTNTNNCPIYVPCESLDTYKTATGFSGNWSDYAIRIYGIPPCETSEIKFSATYADSSTYELTCDGDTSLTSGNTRPISHQYTAMTSAVIGDCVITISDSALTNCYSLTSCTIGSGVTSIGSGAFQECSNLISIDMPNSVRTFGTYVLAGCSALTSVTMGSSVSSIGSYAFSGCSNLISITVNAPSPPILGNYAFRNTSSAKVIYVPSSSVNSYKSAPNWRSFSSIIQAIP